MAALQCEICGGKLIGKPGGLFECEFCGTEYDTAWAKAKIQEIKGTVQVEGTVQVAGTVKVEGGINIESLLKRGILCLEDKLWNDAKRYFDQALDLDAECAQAYFGKACAIKTAENLEILVTQRRDVASMRDFQKGLRFSNPADAARIMEIIRRTETRFAEEDEKKQQEKLRRKSEQQLAAQKKAEELIAQLKQARARIAPAQGLLYADAGYILGVKTDGTVMITGDRVPGQSKIEKWTDIAAISGGGMCTLGLKYDGTVVSAGWNFSGEGNVDDWTDIVQVDVGSEFSVGLKRDGTVVMAGKNRYEIDVFNWDNIIAVAAGFDYVAGLKADGTLVTTGKGCQNPEDFRDWKDIVSVKAGSKLRALNAYGRVYVRPSQHGWKKHNSNDQYWSNIVALDNSFRRTAGIKTDGTVVSVNEEGNSEDVFSEWQDIVAFCRVAGLRSDGTVVSVEGYDTSTWRLFKNIDTLAEERKEITKQEIERLRKELSGLKGFMTGKRKKEIETRLDVLKKRLED